MALEHSPSLKEKPLVIIPYKPETWLTLAMKVR